MTSAQPEAWREALQQRAQTFDASAHRQLGATVKAVKAGDEPARQALLAALWHAAARDPAAVWSVYDALATAWSGADLKDAHPVGAGETIAEPAAYAPAFWPAVFHTLDLAGSGELDAAGITLQVAGLAAHLEPEFGARAEAVGRALPGLNAHEKQTTPPILLADIANAPADALGGHLYRMLSDNGYDPEVLDRDAIGLAALPPAQRYLNTRILQTHDVWHLVAGYETTALHEIAISAFQLAQFGHNYSALFLATVATTSAESRIEGLPILLTIISEAWAHGRRSPPLMTVDWEAHWGTSLQTLRDHIGVQPFQSSLPANLFEMLAAAN